MTNVQQHCEVAVIDEIQMVKDFQRGWAWTRALLGIPATEIHVCGEAAAIDLVREIMISTGEETEVRKYKRLTDLIIEDEAVKDLRNVRPGDCIVCFNKQSIYSVSQGLEALGIECAVIYGTLPPGPKLAMAEKFNDPQDPCKVAYEKIAFFDCK
jgi:ATP-dependent RNA helicase SUPV3L1/SUV3